MPSTSCDYFLTFQSHFICTVPAYKNDYSYGIVNAQVIVEACGGTSEPVHFQYHPGMTILVAIIYIPHHPYLLILCAHHKHIITLDQV